MKNALSRQGSVEVEQQLGQRTTVSVGYQHMRGVNLIISVNQNVPTCAASGSNNGCRPNPNVGENFFSSPVDPTDISKDWGRSDDDQRHRLVIYGSVNTSMAAATTAWERLTHGFQLSSMVQAYSALPYNITSGVTTVQGTASRLIVNGAFIRRNAGAGSDFFNMSLRISRSFKLSGRTQVEGTVEAFNLTNRRNDTGRNTNFGSGAYPTNPSSNFGQITAVGDPRAVQFALRVRF